MTELLREVVDLPGRRARARGILDVAYPLPDGWEGGGVTFRTSGCLPPEIMSICEVDSVDPSTGVRPDADQPVFEPIFVRQSAACATMSQVGTVDLALNRLYGTTEYAVGRLLLDGQGTDNLSFADATSIADVAGTAPLTNAIAAVSCLENVVASTGYGVEAFLHAPSRAAAWLKATDMIDDDGLSPAGHQWVISPGYSPGDSDEITIWATGAVWAGAGASYALSDGMSGRTPGWRHNLDEAWSQRLVLVAFDPCINVSATFTVPSCT